jgi:hypothetical protein
MLITISHLLINMIELDTKPFQNYLQLIERLDNIGKVKDIPDLEKSELIISFRQFYKELE